MEKENNIMEYNGYYASIEFNSGDELFHGKLLNLKDDLVIFEGTSINGLKKAFREAVNDYLQTCEELGKEPK